MTIARKLIARDVIDIRRLRATGSTTAEIAEFYGVTQRTVQRVLTGEIWSSVPADKPLKGFNGRYEVTADGRIWSNVKKDYVVTTKGTVRLTNSGKKTTLEIADILKSHFNR
jgi:predicted transcriptional regulator